MPDSHLHRLIFENSHTACIVLDGHGKITALNPAAELLLEKSSRLAHGHKIQDISPYLDVSAIQPDKISVEQRIIRRGILFEPPDKPTALIDMIVTRPEEESLLIELYRRDPNIPSDQIKSGSLSLSESLMRGLAHEIKNPLGGIRGAAQLLEDEFKQPDVHEFTKIIIDESDRLTKLIDRMLGPNQQPQKTWINIHEITERVRVLLEAQTVPKLSLIKDYDVSIPDIYVDHDQLLQAVLNVAGNAVEALGDSGEIKFRTRILRNNAIREIIHPLIVSLKISDNGPGISAEELPDIFFPMITNKPEGSGLGLSISHSLVKLNGGVLQCTSRKDPTSFEFLIPLERHNNDRTGKHNRLDS